VEASELRNRVLRKIKVLPNGQTADANDASLVDEAWQELYETLYQDNIINFEDYDDIPDEAVRPLVDIMAYEIVDEFRTLNPIEEQKFLGRYTKALRELRKQIAPESVTEPIKAVHF
jgi:hypothetical protein